MTNGQRRILYEIALGRELREDDSGAFFKWGDGRPKPPLEKRIVETLIKKGAVEKDFRGWHVLTSLGKQMLEQDAGRS